MTQTTSSTYIMFQNSQQLVSLKSEGDITSTLLLPLYHHLIHPQHHLHLATPTHTHNTHRHTRQLGCRQSSVVYLIADRRATQLSPTTNPNNDDVDWHCLSQRDYHTVLIQDDSLFVLRSHGILEAEQRNNNGVRWVWFPANGYEWVLTGLLQFS